MTPKELKEIIKVMRKEGVLKLKTKDLELELTPESFKLKPSKSLKEDTSQSNKFLGEYTEEDVLSWSVGNN